MVAAAGGYRQAARGLQELNFRKRAYVTDRIKELQILSPAIAPELIKISTHCAIPEYKGFPHRMTDDTLDILFCWTIQRK